MSEEKTEYEVNEEVESVEEISSDSEYFDNLEDDEMVSVTAGELRDLLTEVEELHVKVNSMEKEENIDDKIERTLVDERIIYLQGTINKDSINSATTMIHYYNLEDDKQNIAPEKRKNIKIHISSEGGELTWCKKLISAMENSKCTIETIAEGGQCASAGYVIFIAGRIRKLSRHTELLYHTLSAGIGGTIAEMQNQLNFYNRIQKEIDEYIVSRTEIPMKKLNKYRKSNLDWHISLEEATKYKMYDELI